jgi:predicted RNase H-like nuclease (RuvC/YqgF family)
MKMVTITGAEYEALRAENARLRERLEVSPDHPYDGIYCRDETISLQDAEIARLTAEVERLNKSRNKWGQKYNKLLEKHKVTLSQLKTAVWSDSEECKLLTAEVERLRTALEKVMIGGNHLVSIIGIPHPAAGMTHDYVLAHYGPGHQYEAWCCWNAIMEARTATTGEEKSNG